MKKKIKKEVKAPQKKIVNDFQSSIFLFGNNIQLHKYGERWAGLNKLILCKNWERNGIFALQKRRRFMKKLLDKIPSDIKMN